LKVETRKRRYEDGIIGERKVLVRRKRVRENLFLSPGCSESRDVNLNPVPVSTNPFLNAVCLNNAPTVAASTNPFMNMISHENQPVLSNVVVPQYALNYNQPVNSNPVVLQHVLNYIPPECVENPSVMSRNSVEVEPNHIIPVATVVSMQEPSPVVTEDVIGNSPSHDEPSSLENEAIPIISGCGDNGDEAHVEVDDLGAEELQPRGYYEDIEVPLGICTVRLGVKWGFPSIYLFNLGFELYSWWS